MNLLKNLERCLMNEAQAVSGIRVDYDGGLYFSGKVKNILLVPFTVILQADGDGGNELHHIEFERARKILVSYSDGQQKTFSA